MLLRISILILCFFHFHSTFAQLNEIRFKHLTINEGLSLSSIYAIHQDKKGFIWFGTEDGLNRYDGYNFKIFRPETGNSFSLNGKWVERIFEDSNGNLWIITQNGLNKYIPYNESFRRFVLSNTSNVISENKITVWFEDSFQQIWIGTENGLFKINILTDEVTQITDNYIGLSNMYFTCIFEDRIGNMWFGTTEGLVVRMKGTDRFTHFYHVDNNQLSLSNNYITAIYEDKSNKIWIGTKNGLNLFERNTASFQTYSSRAENSSDIHSDIIESIFQDNNGIYWIGTDIGFERFNPTQSTFELIVHDSQSSHSLSELRIRPICQDSYGYIWFGTYGEGVFRLEKISGTLENFKNDPAVPTSIAENSINNIFEDRNGTLWFGTFGAGLSYFDPKNNKFPLIVRKPNTVNTLASNFVWSICETYSGEVWIGTNSNGISVFDTKTANFKQITHQPNNPKSLPNVAVRKIFCAKNNEVWIGTCGGGLLQYNKDNETFTQYLPQEGNNNSISGVSVRAIVEDANGNLWIGTTNGLNFFNVKEKTFTRFFHEENNSNSLCANFIYAMYYDSIDKQLFIGTYGGGASIYNIENNRFTNLIHDEKNTNTISDNKVFSFYKDSQKNIWIATNSGLECYTPATNSFRHFTIKNGLPNNVIYGILPDENNNLWLSTNFGICKFQLSDFSCRNYSPNDGLQSTEFNGGAYHKGISGRLYFAGVLGLNAFFPDDIVDNQSQPIVAITGMKIFDKNVNILSPSSEEVSYDNSILFIDNQYYLPKSITYTDTIKLSYNEKVFSFEFAALHFANSVGNTFYYMMQNFDKDWNSAENRRFATYTNLDAGTYVFMVKAKNPDGYESLQPASIVIIIQPPFWDTLLFKISVIFLFLFAIFAWYKIRLNIIKRQKIELENIVQQRTYVIVSKNKELELQNEEIQKQAQELLLANTQIQAANEQLTKANLEIEKKNKDITSSINYASRIQQSMLPDLNILEAELQNSFVFYKPRDVVSGDFYWYSKIQENNIEYQVIIVADCTGHGVPGAFMTAIGHNLLDEIVNNKRVVSPAQILKLLDRKVIQTLKQETENNATKVKVNDGMDMTIVVINQKDKILNFAGAKNPLYYISNNEVNVIKGSKFSIGGVQINHIAKNFEEHLINYAPNDMFYIGTDGFLDQFGGQSGRKFMKNRFIELLHKISKEKVQTQKKILEETMNSWMTDKYIQIDDMLVIGVKI